MVVATAEYASSSISLLGSALTPGLLSCGGKTWNGVVTVVKGATRRAAEMTLSRGRSPALPIGRLLRCHRYLVRG